MSVSLQQALTPTPVTNSQFHICEEMETDTGISSPLPQGYLSLDLHLLFQKLILCNFYA